MKRNSWIVPAWTVLGVVAGLAVPALGFAKLDDIGDAEVHFVAVGPAGLKINGSSGKPEAKEAGGQIVFSSSVAEIKSGISLRDKHTKKYLKADRFPSVELRVQRSALKMPADQKTATGAVKAELTLAGVTKPVTVNYSSSKSGDTYAVDGRFDVDIRQHGIEVPCYLGVCVEPTVKVTAKLKLREQS